MNTEKMIEVLTELRDAQRGYNWVKPTGVQQNRLQRALTAASYLLDDLTPKPGKMLMTDDKKAAVSYQQEAAKWATVGMLYRAEGKLEFANAAQASAAFHSRTARQIMGLE